jgi:NADPH:quinone reductase-like Zn-dependent oxidoreductase
MAKAQMARAWRFTRRGVPRDVLTLDSIPIPSLLRTNIRNSNYLQQPWVPVKVSHVALNPGSMTVVSALPAFVRAKTAIAEAEFAGTAQRAWARDSPADAASAASATGSKLQIGDAVFGMIPPAWASLALVRWPHTSLCQRSLFCVDLKGWLLSMRAGCRLRD